MSISNGNVSPWIVGGDFNVVLNKDEKIGGGVVTASDVEIFMIALNIASYCKFNIKVALSLGGMVEQRTIASLRDWTGC